MFTGIVEQIGRIQRLNHRGGLLSMQIQADRVAAHLELGDSVNIAGACQTVVAVDGITFTVQSVPETLRRTTLGELHVGDPVNLEQALRPNSRLGGHFVLGHVDGVGRIGNLVQRQDSWELTVEAPADLERYIAPKGSIAIDGISLTVAEVMHNRFTVAVIPHTFQNTTLTERRRSDRVNLEVDVIARYLERLVQGDAPSGSTWESLRELGY